jgi:hypothetical protein
MNPLSMSHLEIPSMCLEITTVSTNKRLDMQTLTTTLSVFVITITVTIHVACAQVAEDEITSLRRAIVDLIDTYHNEYPQGQEKLAQLRDIEEKLKQFANTATGELQAATSAFTALRHDALLENPLLDFDQLLLIQRPAQSPSLGLPRNWQSNSSLPVSGYDDQLVTLTLADKDRSLTPLFHPDNGRFVGDIDLHFEADRLLFSMRDNRQRWQVFEIRVDGAGLRQLTGEQPDVDSYDACY